MQSASNHRGFSIVELMIAVAIVGILFSLAIPAFNVYMGNTQLRATAETFNNGLQSAKAFAASRNTPVELILTNSGDIANLTTAEAVTLAAGWMIRTTDRTQFIEGKNPDEGKRGTNNNTQISGTVGSVTFTPLGSTTLAAGAVFSFTNPTLGNCASDTPAGQVRCLNVIVTTTGRVKLCDPATTAPDTRSCS